jgi:hypothetical protein
MGSESSLLSPVDCTFGTAVGILVLNFGSNIGFEVCYNGVDMGEIESEFGW